MCQQKVRLSDQSVGASVQCPRCGSYFTAVSEHGLIAATPALEPSPAIATAPRAIALDADRPGMEALDLPGELPHAMPMPAPMRPRRSGSRRTVQRVGIAALLLSGAALGCVWVPALCVLVMPLAGAGLVIGLVALVLGLRLPRPRFALAVIASWLNAVILIGALFFPVLLGPTYQLARQRGEPEVVTPRVVPLPGTGLPSPEEANAEWPDAGRFALKVGSARLQVVSAAVRPVEIIVKGKKSYSKESYLVLRLRVHQPASGTELANESWSEPGTGQRPQPTLTDNNGNVCQAPSRSELGGEAGELTQKSAVFPFGVTDEVYVFDAPRPGAQYLRLEMPATPWGGTGAIRFTIGRAMWQNDLPQPGKEKSK
jgi:hypothetical protein